MSEDKPRSVCPLGSLPHLWGVFVGLRTLTIGNLIRISLPPEVTHSTSRSNLDGTTAEIPQFVCEYVCVRMCVCV